MKTKRKPKRRGLAPAPARLAEMHREGYGTPAEVAREIGVSGSSIYTWVAAGALKELQGKAPTRKVGPNVWVLFGAAAVKAGIGCVRCGCTEERGCRGGCVWASTDPLICSACVS